MSVQYYPDTIYLSSIKTTWLDHKSSFAIILTSVQRPPLYKDHLVGSQKLLILTSVQRPPLYKDHLVGSQKLLLQ